MTRPNVDGLNRHDVDIFKDIRLPRGLTHVSIPIAAIKDAIEKANAEPEEPAVQDEPNKTKGEPIL